MRRARNLGRHRSREKPGLIVREQFERRWTFQNHPGPPVELDLGQASRSSRKTLPTFMSRPGVSASSDAQETVLRALISHATFLEGRIDRAFRTFHKPHWPTPNPAAASNDPANAIIRREGLKRTRRRGRGFREIPAAEIEGEPSSNRLSATDAARRALDEKPSSAWTSEYSAKYRRAASLANKPASSSSKPASSIWSTQ